MLVYTDIFTTSVYIQSGQNPEGAQRFAGWLTDIH